MLQNPMISGALNRFAPGMAERIRQTGDLVLNDAGSVSNNITNSETTPNVNNNNIDTLKNRLSKL